MSRHDPWWPYDSAEDKAAADATWGRILHEQLVTFHRWQAWAASPEGKNALASIALRRAYDEADNMAAFEREEMSMTADDQYHWHNPSQSSKIGR